jgi:inhibitor of growth protein 3
LLFWQESLSHYPAANMAANEDCASVLEQFIHDVANLPAEINHMMEEIQAKDREMQKYQGAINAKDGNLQKHIKLNGSLMSHPKEKEYAEAILKNYDLCQELQDQKIALSDKACVLLDRQIKKLDVKIRELQNDGQLTDGPPIPSLFNRKAQHPDPQKQFYSDIPPHHHTPLQATSGNAAGGIHHANLNAHRMNSHHLVMAQPVPTRISQIAATNPHINPRNSAPATPASALQHMQTSQQRHRESSVGAISDPNKRRRLNASLVGAMPAQSSSLRQSSLGPGGPGTPKGGTPAASVRAGSLPRSTAAQQPVKKAGLSKKVTAPPHQQISKLKGKPGKRLSGIKKKGQSPSIRSRGGTADDDDSVLSSADASETDTVASASGRSRRGGAARNTNKKNVNVVDDEVEEPDADADVDMEGEDTKEYCFCHSVSYGDMVGCENDQCPYEWFHLKCVGLKEPPPESAVWYCPECRTKPGMAMKMK